MNDSLLELNALVCGSTRGIGHACAKALAARGAAVTLMARDRAALERESAALPADQGQTHGLVCADFDDIDQVAASIASHVASSGPVHILVNNSGGPPGGPAWQADTEQYVTAYRRHLLCNQLLVQGVVEGMRTAAFGRIINIISTSVITPIRGLGVSNVTRGAVGNWGRTLAAELGPEGITVNNVLPGFTATARLGELFKAKAARLGIAEDQVERDAVATIPVGRLGRPEEIAAVVAFLASRAAAYVNGVNLPVDGGRLAARSTRIPP